MENIKNNNKHSRKSIFTWLLLGIVIVVSIVVFSRQFTNAALGYPDADRLLMDGVFIHDFLLDLPLSHIYEYTINYFGQYPALSIGYRPPFFPFIESIFNLIFGINVWSSRLALIGFALVGVTSWFFLVRKIFDNYTAFFSTLLLVTMPFIAKWGWYTMGELPLVSMSMLLAYVFYRYVETNSAKFLFFTAATLVAAIWTKQTAFYLALWFVLYMAFEGILIERLKEKKTWLAILFILICVIPLALITLWLGEQNLTQSIGKGIAGNQSAWMIRLKKIPLHLDNILHYQMTLPLVVLTTTGLISSVIFKERKTVFFALLIFSTFLFFSYVIHKNERYTIFWLPSFTVFAALPVYQLRNHPLARNLFAALLTGVVFYQITDIYSKEPNYATGYDEAAQYVLDHSQSPTVFVDAYNNGYFTYFMRAKDPEKSMYVLRADKLLASSSISATNKLTIHANSKKDIKKILDKFGPEFIVVESRELTGIDIYRKLREFLQNGLFELIKCIPVKSTRPPLMEQNLLIYRYKGYRPTEGGIMELYLPVVGQTIKVPVRGKINDKD